MLASTNNVTPRNSWIVHAVFKNLGSSPRGFCTMLGAMPRSENNPKPVSTVLTIAIMPNASRGSRRVSTTFPPSLSACTAT